ncbi:MAG TPA: prepilin-type N-terminal cleavage/methylation domain-containing protein [Candidatus Sulfotelmatobacter sp.]|nr:prepilin-type N-terminal cleavage/methylation domain-containing protein [Candidatus Sulfotelmatobacter sp.]
MTRLPMSKEKGFSLVELLIVIAIILIIAAIAIPNIIRAKISANESAAVATMRTIYSAEAAYDAQGWNNPTAIGFSAVLQDLGSTSCNPATMTSACLLDNQVANAGAAPKSGYLFTYAPVALAGKNVDFTLNVDPVVRGSTGQRSFFTDSTGVIRYNRNSPGTITDAPLQ